jgi:O-antigen/teichoic acid export membrane protein
MNHIPEENGQQSAPVPAPFRNILRLTVADFIAKTLNFLAFVYLARVLGVRAFGVLGFAQAILMYMVLVADAGLEAWATRAVAQMADMRTLVGRVVALRLMLALGAGLLLLVFLPLLPNYHASLRAIVGLYGLTLLPLSFNLKWVFMGQQKMTPVVRGIAASQILFVLLIFAVVRDANGLLWIPIVRFLSELLMAAYLWTLFARAQGSWRISFRLRGGSDILRPALAMGTSSALELVNYNFDSILLGFLVGLGAVGWYSAAYRPVNVALTVGASFFLGFFPALSRSFAQGPEIFRALVRRSLRIVSVFAVPVGVGGSFLAGPMIGLLFGPDYANSVAPLRVLAWSAVLMLLRGCYEYSLNAAHRQDLHLRAAVTSATVNISLCFLLIPRFGMLGAAWATVTAEAVWFLLAWFFFQRRVVALSVVPTLLRPLAAGAVMAAWLWNTAPLFWVARAVLAVMAYFGVLYLLGEEEVCSWTRLGRR